METRKRIVLQPSYMKNFHCIGSACEDSCCIGWTVSLDKTTYQNYKKNQDVELKPIFNKMVNRNRRQQSDENYGKIKMQEDGRCPFLDEENLCKIHGKIGEHYLSDTCALYPRTTRRIDSKYERSATMSCPEVARIGLFNPNGILFEQVEQDIGGRIQSNSSFDSEQLAFINKPQRYFWDIRLFSLSLLQNRNYSLGERLILLGIAYRKIETLSRDNISSNIPTMLEDMSRMITSGSMRDELAGVQTNLQVQLDIVQEMVKQRANVGIDNQRYLDCLDETLKGVQYTEDGAPENLLKIYEENYKQYFESYMDEKGYILENYLVNEYFKELMPFGNYKTIWDSYIYLCLLYGMLKFHMIGMAGHHKGLDDDLMIKLIQSFSKVVTHSSGFIQGVIKGIKDHGYDSLAYMAVMVKN